MTIIESETKDGKKINKEERLKYELKRVLDKQGSCQLLVNDLTLMIVETNAQGIVFDLKIDTKYEWEEE